MLACNNLAMQSQKAATAHLYIKAKRQQLHTYTLKPKGSNCTLIHSADTTLWLRTTQCKRAFNSGPNETKCRMK